MIERPIKIDYSKKIIPDNLEDLFLDNHTDSAAAFEYLGIGLTETSVRKRKNSEWEAYENVGDLESKFELVKVLAEGNISSKDSQMLAFVSTICDEVSDNGKTRFGRRKSGKSVEITADTFEIDSQILRNLLRVARSEIVFELIRWNHHNNGDKVHSNYSFNLPEVIDFSEVIDELAEPYREFIRVCENTSESQTKGQYYDLLPKFDEPDPINLIRETYDAFYITNSKRGIGTLAAYDTEAMETYYKFKLENGITSSFDMYVIDRFLRSRKIPGQDHLRRFARVLEDKFTNIPLGSSETEEKNSTILVKWIALMINKYDLEE